MNYYNITPNNMIESSPNKTLPMLDLLSDREFEDIVRREGMPLSLEEEIIGLISHLISMLS